VEVGRSLAAKVGVQLYSTLAALKLGKENEMALIACPECKKEFSDQARACPDCVRAWKEVSGTSAGIILGIMIGIIALAAVGTWFFDR